MNGAVQLHQNVTGRPPLRKLIALSNTPYMNTTADGEHTNTGETLRVRENDKMRKEPEYIGAPMNSLFPREHPSP